MGITLVALLLWTGFFFMVHCNQKRAEQEQQASWSNQRAMHEQKLLEAKDEQTRKFHEDWLKAHAKMVATLRPAHYFYKYIEPDLVAKRRKNDKGIARMAQELRHQAELRRQAQNQHTYETT